MGRHQTSDRKIIEEIKTNNNEYDEVIKKVEFPLSATVAFEKLVQDKLPAGFWNEYVGPAGIIFNFKNGPWYIKIAVWPWSWLIITKQILKLLIGRRSAQSHAILSGVMDFYLGRFGKITLG